PERVSHLILMDSALASQADYLLLRDEIRRRKAPYEKELNALVASAAYNEGDPEAVTAYYRIHFQITIKRPEHLEKLMDRMRLSFTNDTVLRSRAIEDHLYEETWLSKQFDLFPALKRLTVPTLIIHGDYEFVRTQCAAHIAAAIPGARFVLLRDCGHFSYM